MVDDCIVVVIPRARCVTPVQEMPHNSGGQLASAFGLEASLQIRQGLMQISVVRAPGNLSSAVEWADKPRRSIKKAASDDWRKRHRQTRRESEGFPGLAQGARLPRFKSMI
jgi:hypothetical protein